MKLSKRDKLENNYTVDYPPLNRYQERHNLNHELE